MPRRRLPCAFSGLRFVPAAGATEPPRPRRPACPASADLDGRRAARPRSGYGPRRRHRPQRRRGGRSPWTPFPSVDRSPRRSASATVRHAAPVQFAPAPPRTIVCTSLPSTTSIRAWLRCFLPNLNPPFLNRVRFGTIVPPPVIRKTVWQTYSLVADGRDHGLQTGRGLAPGWL